MSNEITPDRAYKHISKLLRGYVKKWAPLLGLGAWNIGIEYTWDSDHIGSGSVIVGGRAFSLWQYLRGTIHFYLPSLAMYKEDELEEVAVHELLHLIVEQATYEGSTDEDQEKVITELTRAFLRTSRI
jgi:hypothetical protein